MSYESERANYSKEHISIVEITLDFCDLNYGVSPCTAGLRSITTTAVGLDNFNIGDELTGQGSGCNATIFGISGTVPTYTFEYRTTNGIDFSVAAENIVNLTSGGNATKDANPPVLLTTGDGKCYNTFSSCQDTIHFTNTTGKTYRFCQPRSPHPIAINAKPYLRAVQTSPAIIDIGGGLGVRSNVSASFSDHPSSDFDIDPYVSERTFNPLDRGTFFTKLRSRNAGYQFREMISESGYLVNGIYDQNNFQKRYYVLNIFTASDGLATMVGKDPLKLASDKKALVPKVSTGKLNANITAVETSITLTPAGVGNAEYPISGEAVIKNEVVDFTRAGDAVVLVRGQRNTVAVEHKLGDAFQLCYVQNEQVNIIVEDLLINFANIDPAFINSAVWQSEIDVFLPALLDGIITKPIDVFSVLKELSESAPHYLSWDERTSLITLTALKAPPGGADILGMDANFIGDSVFVGEKPSLRVSTVFVNYGQFDPTKKLDELDNYSGSHVRVDSESVQKFGSNEYKTINSRWINENNLGAAINLATQIGRRFANIPRTIAFSLDPKDSQLWSADMRSINYRDIVDFSGLPIDTIFQILSVSEEQNRFSYSGLEFSYGQELAGDPVFGVNYISISVSQENVNLRTVYDELFPAPDGTTIVVIEVLTGVEITSSTNVTPAMTTGSWPVGATVTLQNNGVIAGKGGNGAGDTTGVAGDGGLALNLEYDLTLVNAAIIGGGGGGGGSDEGAGFKAFLFCGGGGGAGLGDKGLPNSTQGELLIYEFSASQDGNVINGGNGGYILVELENNDQIDCQGASGGDLGQDGNSALTSGGLAGAAIDQNGFVLTIDSAGTILGATIP